MNSNVKKFAKKFFEDMDGKVVLVQSPNLPILGWFIFMIIGYFIAAGALRDGVTILSGAFLFLWAYLEITDGATFFRRFIGATIMIAVVIGFFIR